MFKNFLRVKKRVLFFGFFCMAAPAATTLAETAGIVSGTVTDDRTRAPIAGVAVVAKSPSATYRTTTDAKGQYRFLSVLPDNYSVSFTKSGYASYSTIVVVINGSLQTVNAPISRTLKVIASTHARSAGSAFQRGMTIDTYTVTGSQIEMVQGKAFNTNENQLLRSIPSVTIDKTGTVSIRGGFAFEAAYEFEGIDYTTPSANLQNTLQNISNFGLLNGVGSVQLIPGGGDATHGDTGTGSRALHGQARHVPELLSRRRRSADVSVPAPARAGVGLGRSLAALLQLRRLHRLARKPSSTAFRARRPTRSGRWAPTPRPSAARSIRISSTIRRRFCRQTISSTTRSTGSGRTTASGCSSSFRTRRSRRRSITAAFSSCRTSRAARRPGNALRYPVNGPDGPVNTHAAELCLRFARFRSFRASPTPTPSSRIPIRCGARFWLISSSTARSSARRRR